MKVSRDLVVCDLDVLKVDFFFFPEKSSVLIIPREGRRRGEVIQRDRVLNLIAQKSKQQTTKNQHQDKKK